MKTSIFKFGKQLSWIISFVVIAWSCEKESVHQQSPAQVKAQTEAAAKDNTQIVAATQDVMDITAGALAGQGVTDASTSSYGRITGPELDCAPSINGSFSVDRSHPDSVVFSGTLTIDYGAGTSCHDSTDVRKGKIMDSFVFIKRFTTNALFTLTQTVTFQGYEKDSVQIDGTFISKSSSNDTTTFTIQNAKITYADGTFVSWNGMLTSAFNRGIHAWGKDGITKEVTGSVSGTSRSGAAFSASITKPILFDFSCSRNIPVSGTLELTVDGVVSDIDYGTGDCDNKYTITTGGNTTDYEFKRHHHM